MGTGLCLTRAWRAWEPRYKQNTRTYTQSGAENSLFQFCLTITEPFSPIYLEEMKNY